MDIVDYLTSIGFKPVVQTDEISKFIDPEYLSRAGLFAELHDDNQFFVWYDIENPVIDITLTPLNSFKTKLQIQKITSTYETHIRINH